MNTKNKEFFLVVGLGNPGNKYIQTRHNVGFRVVEFILEQLRRDLESKKNVAFKFDKNYNCLLARTRYQNHQILLIKPQTFMNLSGQTVQSLSSFFKIPLEKILVIHDDIDLDFGTIRLSHDSGPAGHNGIKSIIEKLGSKEFTRLRLGIKTERKENSETFVLKNFSFEEEKQLFSDIIPAAAQAVLDFVVDGFEKTASKHNRSEKLKDTIPLSGTHGDDLGGK